MRDRRTGNNSVWTLPALLLCLAAFFVFEPVARAQDAAVGSSETRVRPLPGEQGDAGGPRTSVDLEHAAETQTSVARIIDETPSAQIRRTGGWSAAAFLSLRGADPSQLRVWIDGVPLTSAAGAAFDLSTIPVELLGSLTLYRADVPVQLGAPTPGGALHLETRFARQDGTRVSVSGGSHGARRLHLAHQRQGDRGELLVAGIYSGAQNNFRFFDDRGTPFNTGDDRWARRANSQADGGGVLLRHRIRIARWRLTTLALGTGDGMGLPGSSTHQAFHTRFSRGRVLASHRAETTRLGWDALDLVLLGAVSLDTEHYRDPESELGLGVRDERQKGWLALLGVQPTVSFEFPLSLRGALDLQGEQLRTRGMSPSARDASRITVGGGLEAELRLWEERITLIAGSRLDWASDQSDEPSHLGATARSAHLSPSPRVGISMEPLPQGPLRLVAHANYGLADRLPTFFELYGDHGSTVGNPELRPEHRRGLDTGLIASWQGEAVEERRWSANLSWTFFDRETRDLIVFVHNTSGVARAQNIARADLRGHELAGSLQLQPGFTLTAQYTRMDAIERRELRADTTLPGRPRHSGSVSAETGWRWFTLGYGIRADGETTIDREGLRPIPMRLEHDLTLSARPPIRFSPTFTVAIQNLLNTQVATVALPDGGRPVQVDRAVADFAGYPLPGFAIHGVVTLHLDGN